MSITDPFDSEEFDAICYAYRSAQGHLPTEVAFRFEAVKTYCRRILAEAQRGAEPVAEIVAAGEGFPYPHIKRLVNIGALPVGTKLYAAPQRTAQENVMKVTDEMVTRFLSWPLPRTFSPDAGITFTKDYNGVEDGKIVPKKRSPDTPGWWPVGTNLFTADEAKQMLEHVLGDHKTAALQEGVLLKPANLEEDGSSPVVAAARSDAPTQMGKDDPIVTAFLEKEARNAEDYERDLVWPILELRTALEIEKAEHSITERLLADAEARVRELEGKK